MTTTLSLTALGCMVLELSRAPIPSHVLEPLKINFTETAGVRQVKLEPLLHHPPEKKKQRPVSRNRSAPFTRLAVDPGPYFLTAVDCGGFA